jgi:hypothetical protein
MSHQEFSPGMIKSAWKKDESSCKKGGQDSYKKIQDRQLVRNPRYFSHHKQVIRTQTMGRSPHYRPRAGYLKKPWVGYPITNHGHIT